MSKILFYLFLLTACGSRSMPADAALPNPDATMLPLDASSLDANSIPACGTVSGCDLNQWDCQVCNPQQGYSLCSCHANPALFCRIDC